VTVSAGGQAADSVQGGSLTISGGSLTLTGTVDSSLTGLTITGGNLDGSSNALPISLDGDFDWNVGNGVSSTIGGGSAVTINQINAHSFTIQGQGTGSQTFNRGTLKTTNPVSVN